MRIRKKHILILGVILFISVFHVAQAISLSRNAELLEEESNFTKPLHTDTMEALSNRQVHPFMDSQIQNQYDLKGFERMAESDEIELWLSKEWNTIRIRNKRTGYIWGALPLENAEGLNKTWNNYGNSIAAIECFDEAGTESRYGLYSNAITTYTSDWNGFTCHANFKELGISFDISVSLQNNKISFYVEEDSIIEGTEGSSYRLKSLTFLPYLGASYSDTIDGYLLIPDGSGSLIRFQKPAQYTATFASRIYGRDLGIEALAQPSSLLAFRPNDYMVEEPQIIMPIYGVVHGAYQNGLFAIVENGAEYATILATPALSNNPYNWGAVRFEFRQKYNKNINRKKGAGAVVPQEHRNSVSPELSVYVTVGKEAHYDGMAILYRHILQNNGSIKSMAYNPTLPMKIEILGADVRDEFIGTSLRIFTKPSQAADIIDTLLAHGIRDLSLVYKCYTRNNEAGKGILKRLGSSKEFHALEEKLKAEGGHFYYYLNPTSAKEHQINKRTQAANNLSNMVIEIARSNGRLMYPNTYFYRLNIVSERIEAALNRAYGQSGQFALDEIGYRLYGDFTSGKERNRSLSMAEVIDMIARLTMREQLPFYQPNQYLWSYTKEFYNAPLCSGQYLYQTDTVPFLQIVLNGSMPLYASSLNIGTYSKERLLRHIEYGVAPSFTLTHCNSMDLYKTAQEDYFSTNFEDWELDITKAYEFISNALDNVWGSTITEHTALENGFIRITYDNGVKIYVNYTGSVKKHGNITVEAGNYRVER